HRERRTEITATSQSSGNRQMYFFRASPFQYKCRSTRAECFHGYTDVRMHGKHHEFTVNRSTFQHAKCFHSVEQRHGNVGNNHIWIQLSCHCDEFSSVCCGSDDVVSWG